MKPQQKAEASHDKINVSNLKKIVHCYILSAKYSKITKKEVFIPNHLTASSRPTTIEPKVTTKLPQCQTVSVKTQPRHKSCLSIKRILFVLNFKLSPALPLHRLHIT